MFNTYMRIKEMCAKYKLQRMNRKSRNEKKRNELDEYNKSNDDSPLKQANEKNNRTSIVEIDEKSFVHGPKGL